MRSHKSANDAVELFLAYYWMSCSLKRTLFFHLVRMKTSTAIELPNFLDHMLQRQDVCFIRSCELLTSLCIVRLTQDSVA